MDVIGLECLDRLADTVNDAYSLISTLQSRPTPSSLPPSTLASEQLQTELTCAVSDSQADREDLHWPMGETRVP